jgi:hypothetical protein
MKRLDIPFLFLGPAGAGKTRTLRRFLEEDSKATLTYPLEQRTFTVGDGYEARVLTSPYHFEIDIPNLSMQDKQIIGDLLTSFFSSGDVLNSLRSSNRKLVVLRRAHSLSLAAAIRVRAILHQYVLPPDAAGMLWMTAREMTGPLSILEDAFIRYPVPRMSFTEWKTNVPPEFATQMAWDKCEGRIERVQDILKYLPNVPATSEEWPRRIQDFYDEMIVTLIQNSRSGRSPNLLIVQWVRGIVYQCLSFCQTGPEIIDSCAAALQRLFLPNSKHLVGYSLEPHVFWLAMKSLTKAEPHTSYRTPLSLESALLFLYETIRTESTKYTFSAGTTEKGLPIQDTHEQEQEQERAHAPPKLEEPSTSPVHASIPTKTIKPRVRKSKTTNP